MCKYMNLNRQQLYSRHRGIKQNKWIHRFFIFLFICFESSLVMSLINALNLFIWYDVILCGPLLIEFSLDFLESFPFLDFACLITFTPFTCHDTCCLFVFLHFLVHLLVWTPPQTRRPCVQLDWWLFILLYCRPEFPAFAWLSRQLCF